MHRDIGPFATAVDPEPLDCLGAVALTVDQLARGAQPLRRSLPPAAQPPTSGPTVGRRQR
jgi:hypothetical protein